MPTIYDIDQLSQLRGISEDMSVSFKLHGGVAFRFALHLAQQWWEREPESKVDLFSLAPFTADIDLLHSGPNPKTSQIRNEILSRIPNADCFRWEVRSELTQKAFDEASVYEPEIPARSIVLTPDGIEDRLGGLRDIDSKRFRFIRKAGYRESSLYKKGRSLEILAALIYLQTLFEAHLTPADWYSHLDSGVSNVFQEAVINETRNALVASPYLRARFSYLLVNCILAASPTFFWIKAAEIGLGGFLASIEEMEFLPGELREYLRAGPHGASGVLSPSSALGPERRRLPFITSAWMGGQAVTEKLSRFAVDVGTTQRAIMASPLLRLAHGRARVWREKRKTGSNESDESVKREIGVNVWRALLPRRMVRKEEIPDEFYGSAWSAEFVYFALPNPSSALGETIEFAETDLSILAVVKPWWATFWPRTKWRVFSLPCIVERQHERMGLLDSALLIRANTLGLFDWVARLPGGRTQFILVGLLQGSEQCQN